eukprot:m51a1_g2538 hypothetical protein (365) ;mRNA; f:257543-259033
MAESNKCATCGKSVFAMEALRVDKSLFHKSGCFKCLHCGCGLRAGNYAGIKGKYYCKPHFKQLFALKGDYASAFGEEKPGEKWAREKSGSPGPQRPDSAHDSSEQSTTAEIAATSSASTPPADRRPTSRLAVAAEVLPAPQPTAAAEVVATSSTGAGADAPSEHEGAAAAVAASSESPQPQTTVDVAYNATSADAAVACATPPLQSTSADVVATSSTSGVEHRSHTPADGTASPKIPSSPQVVASSASPSLSPSLSPGTRRALSATSKNRASVRLQQLKLNGLTMEDFELAQEKFRKYDVDGNGTIDREEFSVIVDELNPNKGAMFRKRTAEMLFNRFDTDKSGDLDEIEFLAVYSELLLASGK